MNFQLTPFTPHWDAQVRALQLNPQQQPFVDDTDFILQSLGRNGLTGHVMLHSDTVVGFFRLDQQFATSHPFASASAVGLRSFFVGNQHQGRGYAKQALLALPHYLPQQGMAAAEVMLTVNCKNDSAYQLYQRCNFADTGELYLDGGHGPQHIMVLRPQS
jgi:ribosomal protein S18 acetylase RimI-like enzyme